MIVVGVAFLFSRLLPDVPVPVYGEAMPQWRAVDLDGRDLVGSELLGGHLGLLLYADRLPSLTLVRYLEVLLERYRDHGAGFRVVVAVAPEHTDPIQARATADGVSFGLIHDSGGALRRSLRLQAHADHSFLVGPDGRLLLSTSGLVSREELRQHVEKHLLGRIEYAASPVTLLGPDARLPAYEVYEVVDAAGGDATVPAAYAPSSDTTVVALTAALCEQCDPSGLYKQLSKFLARRCGGGSEQCRVELLVTAGFPASELLSSVRLNSVKGLRVFQATGTLVGLEDDYFTNRRAENPDNLVLRVGADRTVLAVSNLEDDVEALHAGS